MIPGHHMFHINSNKTKNVSMLNMNDEPKSPPLESPAGVVVMRFAVVVGFVAAAVEAVSASIHTYIHTYIHFTHISHTFRMDTYIYTGKNCRDRNKPNKNNSSELHRSTVLSNCVLIRKYYDKIIA